MSEAKRLRTLLNHLKMNASEFARIIGVQQSAISAITREKKRITRDILDAIADNYPDVNLNWLLKGRGLMLAYEWNEPETVSDKAFELHSKTLSKSTNSLPPIALPSEDRIRKFIGDNLKSGAKRWGFSQLELIEFLGDRVSKQAASAYMRGENTPKLTVLLQFEKRTGWPLNEILTRTIEYEQIPDSPLPGDNERVLSEAEIKELREDLHRLGLRLKRTINKIDGE
ncbi:MAG: helix-turn-helix transcriptional regulator [Saprospiraceae bacterium]